VWLAKLSGARQATLGGDAELLVKLAHQRLLRRLAGLDLAAGKLPETGQRLSLRPLRQKDAAVGIDQRAGDDEQNAAGRLAHAVRSRRQ
jgi:hypothetical protein